MDNYLNLLREVLNEGTAKSDRTGTGTLSVFGRQLSFNLRKGFPLVTTKKVHLKSIIHELLWFLRGSTNATELQDVGVRIWNEWAQPEDVYYRQKRSGYEIKLAWAELKQITVADADEKIKQMTAQFRVDHPEMDHFRIEIIEAMIRDLIVRDGVCEYKEVLEKAKGELGPVYGKQWRAWPTPSGNIDQIANVIERLKTNPDCRRLIVSAWNVGQLDQMALMPCHNFFQFYTRVMSLNERIQIGIRDAHADGHQDEVATLADLWQRLFGSQDGTTVVAGTLVEEAKAILDELNVPERTLSCMFNMRSADLFLGVPFNIASYALLTMMVAQVVGMDYDRLVLNIGDAHIYSNHLEQVTTQLSRDPLQLPTMRLNKSIKNIDEFTFDDFTLMNYVSHPAIKGEVAV